MPRVSAIITTYNRVQFLAAAIDSVLAQSFRDFELIVVDDGSTDDTAACLGQYGDRLQYVRIPHSGMPERARNSGLARARGDLIALLDDDDLWHPDKLAQQVNLLDRFPDRGFAYCDIRVLNPDGTLSEPRTEPRHKRAERFFDHLLGGWSIYPSSLMVRHEWLQRLGPIDETPATQGESAFLLRLAHAAQAVFVPAPLVYIRRHPRNLSRLRDLVDYQNLIVVYRQLLEHTPLTAAQRRQTRATIARMYTHIGLAKLREHDTTDARQYFLSSLRWNPLQRRAWTALMRTLAGPR